MDNKMEYKSPLSSRYASKEMKYIFSEQKKFTTWHELWIALAKAEKELGLNITQEQIDEMVENKDIVDFEVAEAREKEVRHDVMSHVYAYGKRCPKAEPIIHLGATSCYVGDNTDILLMRDALKLILEKAIQVELNLTRFAIEYKDLPCLGYTPPAAGTADHRGQESDPVDVRTGNGYRRAGASSGRSADAGFQGNHRYSGKLYGSLRE